MIVLKSPVTTWGRPSAAAADAKTQAALLGSMVMNLGGESLNLLSRHPTTAPASAPRRPARRRGWVGARQGQLVHRFDAHGHVPLHDPEGDLRIASQAVSWITSQPFSFAIGSTTGRSHRS